MANFTWCFVSQEENDTHTHNTIQQLEQQMEEKKRVPLVVGKRAAGSPATWSMTVEGFAFSVLSRRQGGKVSFHLSLSLLSFILLIFNQFHLFPVSLSVVLYTHTDTNSPDGMREE